MYTTTIPKSEIAITIFNLFLICNLKKNGHIILYEIIELAINKTNIFKILSKKNPPTIQIATRYIKKIYTSFIISMVDSNLYCRIFSVNAS